VEPTDLTGRARIRDSALVLFGERGVERTSLREIAAAAGVTAGLVRHHFGSKDGLRAVCDAYALERVMAVKEAGVAGGRLADAGFLSDVQPELMVLHRFLARSIVDGSPAAGALLDRMIVLSERWVTANLAGTVSDHRAVAGVLAAAQIGMLMVREQLSRVLDLDPSSVAGQLRLSHALIDFYSTPLLSSALAREAHAALDQVQQSGQERPAHDAKGAQRT
jgi:AcrR family transcriptional regulator